MDWVAGAIDETTQKGSAWNLFEDELLERLAAVMEKQHPKLCPPLAEQPSTEELLKPVFEAATAKLETVAAKTPSRHRSTFGQIARLIVNVDKARRKLRYLGERNLRAQINQNRVRMHKERVAAKKAAEEARKKRKEAYEAAKAEKERASGAAVPQPPSPSKPKSETSEESEDEESVDADESEESDESDEESDEDDSESSDDDTESKSSKAKSTSDAADVKKSPSKSSKGPRYTFFGVIRLVVNVQRWKRNFLALKDNNLMPREKRALERLERLRSMKHQPPAPGTLHAQEQRERAKRDVMLTPAYEHAKEAELKAFKVGWHEEIATVMHAGLRDQSKARLEEKERLQEAKSKGVSAKDQPDRTEVQQVEGKLQAIGNQYSQRRFQHVPRQPSMLEPPAIDKSVRERVIRKAGAELLVDLKFAEGLEPPPATPLQQLMERQVKFVCQRAMWREAQRRASEESGQDSKYPAVELRRVMGLLGEGVAAGLAVVPTMNAKLMTLSGAELPPALRVAAWSASMSSEAALAKNAARLRGCPLAKSAAGHPDEETDNMLASVPWQMLSRPLGALQLTPAERYEVEGRACAVLLQAHECGSSEVPNVTALGSLVMAVVLGTPQPPLSEGVVKRRAAEERRRAASRTEVAAADRTRKNPLEQPLEPLPVTLLLHAAEHGISAAVRAAADAEKGFQPLIRDRWPRLYKHLMKICSRADLADVVRRKKGPQPPSTTLQHVVEEEWLTHGFVGALPREALLWAWDQFALQGWALASELAACCFYLIRREVRRLDVDDDAGATELRVAMCVTLQKEGKLEELQALLAPANAKARQKAGMQNSQPQVQIKIPMATDLNAGA